MAAGKINSVTVYKLDRLSRDVALHEQLIKEMREAQVEWRSVNEKFEASPMGTAFRQILAVFAQLERATIALRLFDGKRAAMTKKGSWGGGTPPFGFAALGHRYASDTGEIMQLPGGGELVPVDTEIEQVRLIFELRAKGASPRGIVRWLNSQGHTGRGGKKFYQSLIRDILAREDFYQGERLIHNNMAPEPQKIAHKAILAPEMTVKDVKSSRHIRLNDLGQIVKRAWLKVPPQLPKNFAATIARAEELRSEGLSIHCTAQRLNEEGHTTAWGSQFYATTVKNLVKDAEAWREVIEGRTVGQRVQKNIARNCPVELSPVEEKAVERAIELYSSGELSYEGVALALNTEFEHPRDGRWFAADARKMVLGMNRFAQALVHNENGVDLVEA